MRRFVRLLKLGPTRNFWSVHSPCWKWNYRMWRHTSISSTAGVLSQAQKKEMVAKHVRLIFKCLNLVSQNIEYWTEYHTVRTARSDRWSLIAKLQQDIRKSRLPVWKSGGCLLNSGCKISLSPIRKETWVLLLITRAGRLRMQIFFFFVNGQLLIGSRLHDTFFVVSGIV